VQNPQHLQFRKFLHDTQLHEQNLAVSEERFGGGGASDDDDDDDDYVLLGISCSLK
jgi:hypothetical protein